MPKPSQASPMEKPTPVRQLSDLVLHSKLETSISTYGIQHMRYKTGYTAQNRRIGEIECWKREGRLGSGSYGHVYREKCIEDGPPRFRAVKDIDKYKLKLENLDYERELEAIFKFSHPTYSHCFVRANGWWEDGISVFIAMEYFELGDLRRHLGQPLPELQAQQITSHLSEGLMYMHENGFVHRDLKPANIMVVAKGPAWFIKIADFGICKRKKPDTHFSSTLSRGTDAYAAPEQLDRKNTGSADFPVDIWALGAVAYELLTNKIPFPDKSDKTDYVEKKKSFPIETLRSGGISGAAQAFLVKLLSPEPQKRPSARGSRDDPWISIAIATTSEMFHSLATKANMIEDEGGSEDTEQSTGASTSWTDKITTAMAGITLPNKSSTLTSRETGAPKTTIESSPKTSINTTQSLFEELRSKHLQLAQDLMKAERYKEAIPHIEWLLEDDFTQKSDSDRRSLISHLAKSYYRAAPFEERQCFKGPHTIELEYRFQWECERLTEAVELLDQKRFQDVVDLLLLPMTIKVPGGFGDDEIPDFRDNCGVELRFALVRALAELEYDTKALTILSRIGDMDDLDDLEMLFISHMKCGIYIRRPDWKSAKRYGRDAVTIVMRREGRDHPTTLEWIRTMIHICWEGGDPDEALWEAMLIGSTGADETGYGKRADLYPDIRIVLA